MRSLLAPCISAHRTLLVTPTGSSGQGTFSSLYFRATKHARGISFCSSLVDAALVVEDQATGSSGDLTRHVELSLSLSLSESLGGTECSSGNDAPQHDRHILQVSLGVKQY